LAGPARSVWPSLAGPGLELQLRELDLRKTLWLAVLIAVLVAEGFAITHSYMWAAPLACLLVVAIAIDIPLVPFLGVALLVRVLTDASLSSPGIRTTGALNLSAAIALLLMLVAIGLVLRQRRGLLPAALALIWLGFWTAITVKAQGAGTETIREGVRETSIIAVALIVYNARRAISVATAVRIVQLAGVVAAIVALQQLATHGGLLINGDMRSNGTFVHPDGAAMFFAIAAVGSLWRYVDAGRGRLDALAAAIFAAATISTFSLTGLATLMLMLMIFGALRPGSFQVKFRAFAIPIVVLAVFLATPLGSERISEQSSTELTTAHKNGSENTSLAWRFYKWGLLLDEWERAPFLGKGLGTTVALEGTIKNERIEKVPHNEYLRYLLETGAIGLALLLAALVVLIRRLAVRRGAAGPAGAAALGIAIVTGCLLDAVADNTVLYTTTGYAVAIIVAAVLALPPAAARRSPAPRGA
jgi:O-antigen ligase